MRRVYSQNDVDKFFAYHIPKSAKQTKKITFKADTLFYNEDKGCYYCPMGQVMQNIGTYEIKTKTGFSQTLTGYQAGNSNGFPLKGICHQSNGNRKEISHSAKRYRQQAKRKSNA